MCTAVLLAGCTASSTDLEQRVDELYNRMTQQERIAQLRSMYMDELFDEAGHLDTTKCRELIPDGIGHFSQYASQKPREANELRDRVAALQDWLIKNTPSGIPALFHEEVLSGINTRGATIYPQQIGQACSFNTQLAEVKTRQTGEAMRKMGGVLSLSPMVDVCRVPSFNRLEESYGEDAYLSAAMGVAFVRGLQQGDLKRGVGACSKHYLGYGGGGDADEKELMEEILMPHEAMIRLAGSKALMPGYHAMRTSPNPSEGGELSNCVANSWILQDILRDYLGFDGMVVSDYTAIDQLAPSQNSNSSTLQSFNPKEKAALAINAGNDVDFPFGANYQYLQEALDEGLVKPEAFERAVKDVLRYKLRCGLLDDDAYLYSKEDIKLDTPEERQTAYEIATQSIVLLENPKNILPLDKYLNNIKQFNIIKGLHAPAKILLTGPNANTMWAMCGDYSFPAMSYFWKKVTEDLDHPHVVTLLEGMQMRKPADVDLLYSRGCDWTDTIETDFVKNGDARAWEYEILHRKVDAGEKIDKPEALRMAREADVIVAAVGENVMLCGENRDRQGLRLPGRQEQYVEELIATGKPVVLVVFGGRAQVLGDLAKKCAAVIQAWYPGEEGGKAVADILYGKVSPSAKLAVSYPDKEIYEPLCYNNPKPVDVQLNTPSPLYHTPNTQWVFGYGLSYTTFEYSDLKMADSQKLKADGFVELSFCVKNTGKRAADEVAQIYLTPTTDEQPIRRIQLQGFARVSLQPGEKKTVRVKLYTEQFGYYKNTNGKRSWNVEPGTYAVKIGASSVDFRLQERITLTGDAVSRPLRKYYFSETTIE
jgi:beta-glucosidase